MALEIERKFLVAGDGWRGLGEGTLLRQGYLSAHPERVVRVRIDGGDAYLTVKGKTSGAVRQEWEYPISLADADAMLNDLCEKPLIEKYRHRIRFGGMTWEVDEFLGENAGLVVAEVELANENQVFDKPHWLGKEVSADPRYFNSNLQSNPYARWQTDMPASSETNQ